jgi:hypothetical protein
MPEISQLDHLFVLDFLVEGMSRDPERSVWRNIRRLPVGHLLRFWNGSLELARFQQLPVEDPLLFKDPNVGRNLAKPENLHRQLGCADGRPRTRLRSAQRAASWTAARHPAKREARPTTCASRASVSAWKLKCRCVRRGSVRGSLRVVGVRPRYSFRSCREERRVEWPCLPFSSRVSRVVRSRCECARRPPW